MCGSDSGASAIEERKSSMKRVLFIVCGILGVGALTAGGVASTCYGTFGLKGGQLAGITTVRGEGRITRIAIVGGTGSYEGARGSVISVTRRSNDRFSDDTIHLIG